MNATIINSAEPIPADLPEFPAIYTAYEGGHLTVALARSERHGTYLSRPLVPDTVGDSICFGDPNTWKSIGFRRLASPVTIRFEGWSA